MRAARAHAAYAAVAVAAADADDDADDAAADFDPAHALRRPTSRLGRRRRRFFVSVNSGRVYEFMPDTASSRGDSRDISPSASEWTDSLQQAVQQVSGGAAEMAPSDVRAPLTCLLPSVPHTRARRLCLVCAPAGAHHTGARKDGAVGVRSAGREVVAPRKPPGGK